MSNSSSFRRLEVWQQAMTLVEEVYGLSKRFPRDERFGLTSQLRRAAISIPRTLARARAAAYLNHLDIALGSQGEVEVQLELAVRLGFCRRDAYEQIQERVERIGRMLNGLIGSLQPLDDDWS